MPDPFCVGGAFSPHFSDYVTRILAKIAEARPTSRLKFTPPAHGPRSAKVRSVPPGTWLKIQPSDHLSSCQTAVPSSKRPNIFATVLLREGGDDAAVSKLMGHASVKMTVDQYYHLLGDEKRQTIAKLPSLSRPEEVGTSPSV